MVDITAFRQESKSCKGFFFEKQIFHQWEHLNLSQVTWFITWPILKSCRRQPPIWGYDYHISTFWLFPTFKGVMSYDQHCSVIPVSWSSCSRNDFIKQYNKYQNIWCMAAKTSNFCGKFKKPLYPSFWIVKCNAFALCIAK